ncbi:hypothetical protein D9611_008798 [Ephemerocybe angulata]|uniref:Phosphoglycerate mutase n=1 Tax=Ephemerocybe angulata TaxID=980116 RepID=A0A8H5CCC8_9AGAR|nr:hypothetical protein D9611_008798 [Tulosesus angulatus]
MVKITFVRHGESVDNLKDVWAGSKDSPLTNHGMRQAEHLALSFSSLPITAIYTSNLGRAQLTAKAILAAQPPSNKVPLHTSELLQEQSFGAAEGKSYKVKRNEKMTTAEHYARGIFPTVYNRNERFPGGESKNDVAARARRFLDEVLMPYVWQEDVEKNADESGSSDDGPGLPKKPIHIVIVSHGLFIPELVALLAMKDEKMAGKEADVRTNVRGMRNTAWTRVEFGFKRTEEANATVEKTLKIRFTHVNVSPHLEKLQRQKGGIARLAHDPAQKDIRTFFAR